MRELGISFFEFLAALITLLTALLGLWQERRRRK